MGMAVDNSSHWLAGAKPLALLPGWERCIIVDVRVIARKTLNLFVENRVDQKFRKIVKAQLDAWYAEAEKATWKNPAEIKQQYRSASIVSPERVVFNIKGNDYRLVVAISYPYQVLLVIWLGTHREYDKIDVRKVEYDKRRYADPSD
jgi:mRNA interferase HigB